MPLTIFYSWQSDRPNATNRSFIEDSIAKAIAVISEKIEIQNAIRDEEIKLDKDTQGVPGTPPIVETIFKKIDNCTIFIPDLTFVGKSPEGRMLPNPNVLIEYGWALKSISYSRIIPVMNTAFGELTNDNMPFNMRHLRNPITYNLQANSKEEDKIFAKHKLIKALSVAIGTIIKSGIVEEMISEKKKIEEISFTNNPSQFFTSTDSFAIISDSKGSEKKLFMPDGERLFLRLIPGVDFKTLHSQKKAFELLTSGDLKPMGNGNFGFSICRERNKYGAFISYFRKEEVTNLTQLFLSGQLWGIDRYGVEKEYHKEFAKVSFGYFASNAIEDVYHKTLSNYLSFAQHVLKLTLPIKYVAGATDVEGFRMAVPGNMYNRFQGKVVNNHIVYEGQITDYDQKTTEILIPFFNHLWEECGLDRPNMEYLK